MFLQDFNKKCTEVKATDKKQTKEINVQIKRDGLI